LVPPLKHICGSNIFGLQIGGERDAARKKEQKNERWAKQQHRKREIGMRERIVNPHESNCERKNNVNGCVLCATILKKTMSRSGSSSYVALELWQSSSKTHPEE
jgi:hypothetical protein